MSSFHRILANQNASTILNAVLGASMLAGLVVVLSSGITQQRREFTRKNQSLQCVQTLTSIMNHLKSRDNNRQGSTHFMYANLMSFGAKEYSARSFDPYRYNFKLIYDESNETLKTSIKGGLENADLDPRVDSLLLTPPFDDIHCGGNCTEAISRYNENARRLASQATNTYQNQNHTAVFLNYFYNQDKNYCLNEEGKQIKRNPGWERLIPYRFIASNLGSGQDFQLFARIQQKNLINSEPGSCKDQGEFRLVASTDKSLGENSPWGLELELRLDYFSQARNQWESCSLKNVFSQTISSDSPQLVRFDFYPTKDIAGQKVDLSHLNRESVFVPAGEEELDHFCYMPPEPKRNLDSITHDVTFYLRANKGSSVIFCQLEFMPNNRGFRLVSPYAGDAGTVPSGYEYQNTGWFVCKLPVESLEAGVDVKKIDVNDLESSLLNNQNLGDRAKIKILNQSRAINSQVKLKLKNLPLGDYRFSSFVVNANQIASEIIKKDFQIAFCPGTL